MRSALDQPAIHALCHALHRAVGASGPWQRTLAAQLRRHAPAAPRRTWQQRLAAWLLELPALRWLQPEPPPPLTPSLVATAQAALVQENLLRGLPWFQAFDKSIGGAVEMLSSISDQGVRFAALVGAWLNSPRTRPWPSLPTLTLPGDLALSFWIFEDAAQQLAVSFRQPPMRFKPRPLAGLRRTVVLEALTGLSLQRDQSMCDAVSALAAACPLAMLVYADAHGAFHPPATGDAPGRYHSVICPGNGEALGWQRVWTALVAQSLVAALEAPAPSADLLEAVQAEQFAQGQFLSFRFLRPWAHLAARPVTQQTLRQERIARMRFLAAIFGHHPPDSHFFKGWFWTFQIRRWLAMREQSLPEWRSQAPDGLRGRTVAMFASENTLAFRAWAEDVLGVKPEEISALPVTSWDRSTMSNCLFDLSGLSDQGGDPAVQKASGVSPRDITNLFSRHLESPSVMPFRDEVHGHEGPSVFQILRSFDLALQSSAPQTTTVEETTRTTYE